MQKVGVFNLANESTGTMKVHPLLDTHLTTYFDDERLIQTTAMISPHLEGIPRAYIVTTPTFSSATYGLPLLASGQLRWTTNLPEEYIHIKLPKNLRKSLLAQVQTITSKNVDKPNNAKDTCTVHCHEFQGLSTPAAFNLFRAADIKTLHKNITADDLKHQNQRPNSLENRSQAT